MHADCFFNNALNFLLGDDGEKIEAVLLLKTKVSF